MAQRTEPAQHGRHHRARERAVALLEGGEFAGVSSISSSERRLADHALDDIGCNAPDGKSGHLDSRHLAGTTRAGDRPRLDPWIRLEATLDLVLIPALPTLFIARNSSLQAGYGYAK